MTTASAVRVEKCQREREREKERERERETERKERKTERDNSKLSQRPMGRLAAVIQQEMSQRVSTTLHIKRRACKQAKEPPPLQKQTH